MPKRSSLFPIFFTVFLDMLGLGIVIPIIAPVFLNSRADGIFPFGYSLSTRTFILGLVIAAYPLAQFISAPLLGALSDRIGRKPILIISLWGTCLGYLLAAIAIVTQTLPLLFLGRVLDGFTGGNISVAYSAIADVSDKESKARNFGLVGMAFGLGFIIGPFIGGRLADPTLVSWFTYATPLWVTTALALVNVFLVSRYFRETLTIRRHTKITLFAGITNIHKAFLISRLRTIFIVLFLLAIGFNFFTQFFQVFLLEKFRFNESQIGNMFAYTGAWLVLAQGWITRPLAKIWSPPKVLSFSVIFLAIALFALLIPSTSLTLFLILPFVAIFQGLTHPNSTAIVSNLTGADSQGEVLGINQSIHSLAQAIPPIIAGIVASIDASLPLIFASSSVLVAWFIFMFFFKPRASAFQ